VPAILSFLSLLLIGSSRNIDEDDKTSQAYIIGVGLALPFALSGLFIYLLITHFRTDFDKATTSAEWAFIINMVVIPAIGKILIAFGIIYSVVFGRKNKNKM
jgi:hypothetical protein